MRKHTTAVIILSVCLLLSLPGILPGGLPSARAQTAVSLDVKRSVVRIVPDHRFAAGPRTMSDQPGSGVIVHPSGLILTAWHVLSEDNDFQQENYWDDFTVEMIDDDDSLPPVARYRARIVATRADMDLALLRIDRTIDEDPIEPGELDDLPWLPVLGAGEGQLDPGNTLLSILGYPKPLNPSDPTTLFTNQNLDLASRNRLRSELFVQRLFDKGYSGGPALVRGDEGFAVAGVVLSAVGNRTKLRDLSESFEGFRWEADGVEAAADRAEVKLVEVEGKEKIQFDVDIHAFGLEGIPFQFQIHFFDADTYQPWRRRGMDLPRLPSGQVYWAEHLFTERPVYQDELHVRLDVEQLGVAPEELAFRICLQRDDTTETLWVDDIWYEVDPGEILIITEDEPESAERSSAATVPDNPSPTPSPTRTARLNATATPTDDVVATVEAAVRLTLTAAAPAATATRTPTRQPPTATATPTLDMDAAVAATVDAVLTARAPTATRTPTPTRLPPTATATPTPNVSATFQAAVNATLTARAPTATSTRTKLPTATPTRKAPTATATPTQPPTLDAAVNTNSLNLRAGPSTAYSLRGDFSRGEKGQVFGRNADGSWVAITMSNGQSGWMALSLLDVEGAVSSLPVVQASDEQSAALPFGWAGETNEIDGVVFHYVPDGEFLMGNSPEQVTAILALCAELGAECHPNHYSNGQPRHPVYVDGFWMMRHEVTNEQYSSFIADDGYTTERFWSQAGWAWVTEPGNTGETSVHVQEWDDDDLPVLGVSWYEAEAFAAWFAETNEVAARLPTEAEWEKAASGTDGLLFPWGNEWDSRRANTCDRDCEADWKLTTADDGYAVSSPVGAFPSGASPYGLLDMAGNAYEWTGDRYQEDYYSRSPAANPTGPTDGKDRVMRGGAWWFHATMAVSTVRLAEPPDLQEIDVGFRLVVEEE